MTLLLVWLCPPRSDSASVVSFLEDDPNHSQAPGVVGSNNPSKCTRSPSDFHETKELTYHHLISTRHMFRDEIPVFRRWNTILSHDYHNNQSNSNTIALPVIIFNCHHFPSGCDPKIIWLGLYIYIYIDDSRHILINGRLNRFNPTKKCTHFLQVKSPALDKWLPSQNSEFSPLKMVIFQFVFCKPLPKGTRPGELT